MWKMHEKPKTVVADLALAQRFMNMAKLTQERALSDRRMQVYERIWAAREFRTVIWASAHCPAVGLEIRVNGMHTSTIAAGKTPEQLRDNPFFVTIESWWCDTLEDVGRVYATYDSALASRSNRDINLSFWSAITNGRKISQKHIHNTVSAAAFLKWSDNDLKKISPAEKAEELVDRLPFIDWLEQVLPTEGNRPASLTGNSHLTRSPVCAAMMATFDTHREKAKEFWILVREESHPSVENATRTLAKFLTRVAMAGGGSETGRAVKKQFAGFREIYCRCLLGWNAWLTGKTTKLTYYADKDVPTILKPR